MILQKISTFKPTKFEMKKMKNFKSLTVIIICILFSISNANAQARKFPLFEHFTQASCGPCADQNPSFSSVYSKNEADVHHIAYHTSWPGVDPMYSANPTESNAMVDYYGVSGVPTIYIDGDVVPAGPIGVNQVMIDDEIALTSPIIVYVDETTDGTTRNVSVKITTVGTVPSGSYRIKAAAVEKLITYASPPGSNGEKEFPNVFREFLNGSSGEVITLPDVGSSATYDFTYTLDPSWNADAMYALVWIQNYTTKDVLNSGASNDPRVRASLEATNFVKGFSGTSSSLEVELDNVADVTTNAEIVLSENLPEDWSASFTIDGNTYSESTVLSITESDLKTLTIQVTPGTTPELGVVSIYIYNPDIPASNPTIVNYYVISGITDLIVNNNASYGNGKPYGFYSFESYIPAGLTLAGNTTFTSTYDDIMKKGFEADALSDVKFIYYNVGWTFPSITAAEVPLLETYLNDGGRLFIAGQDIGWEIMDPASFYLDPVTESFYTDYLHAGYITDNASGATELTPVSSDTYFGTLESTNFKKPYGPTYFYPDQIEPIDAFGSPIFYYNDNADNIAGIRAEKDNYKIVYLGVGIEMLMDEDMSAEFIKLAHDYFREGYTGIEFENAVQALLGNAYPNPANSITTIAIQNMNTAMQIVVTDLSGRKVMMQDVSAGASTVQLNTSNLESGIYFYYLTDGNIKSSTQKLEIIK